MRSSILPVPAPTPRPLPNVTAHPDPKKIMNAKFKFAFKVSFSLMIFVLKYFPRLTDSREVTLLPPLPTHLGVCCIIRFYLCLEVTSPPQSYQPSLSLSVLVSDYVIVDLPLLNLRYTDPSQLTRRRLTCRG
jgi:hypothetical protein